ncbi:glycoside hydrolase family 35 protein [Aerococcus sanguinicola]|nr:MULTISPECIES: beta-galactosidase family protein [unclassified Aerococcus]KAB0647366.1 beta-galactosidase [Aerococcus sanguinicola]MDK6233170.1 beta-galactosidase [Aerococcus sp. UMB10185]MDK6856007.1 beta-galactosidase [Aerococcus sp. UMB7533]MDK8502398.1 beta-galactosidase [Aerococcus sp. UMB1112A]OFN00313.1 beta-galactosidase [Aerococcus sp. HMSC062A02]
MTSFNIQGEDFVLDGQPFKILSGAIHYFRLPRADWEHSLYNLKALGFNTVETYIPWNWHEPQEGEFDFEGDKDVCAFIETAEALGLYVIIRPSPYICAEWEFGGLPGWLPKKCQRMRSSDPDYLQAVQNYYDVLLPKLKPYQITEGGPILMVQIENEYGSYGEDKAYLKAIYRMLRAGGIDVPLFTSDGAWRATLRAGTLTDLEEENILMTGNFGSRAKKNFTALRAYQEEVGQVGPLMCMEFWDGWFNRWGSDIVTRETSELVDAVREALEIGSINLYMFHGGTNFGFMNGCSARGTRDLPQISSYDYGAPLDEQGNPTDKYYAIQELIHEMFPDLSQAKPRIKSCLAEQELKLADRVNLFEVLEDISDKKSSLYPQSMDQVGQYYGYMVYRTQFEKDTETERLRLIDGRDRAHVYVNQDLVATQYQEEIGEDIEVDLSEDQNQLDILFENMGRVNYGHKLQADTQEKGLRQGAMADLHFMLNWDHYLIDFDRADQIDFSKDWSEGQAAFYRFELDLDQVEDTFLDLTGFGKGIVLVNGHNLGRYWERGPIRSLYCPGAFLQAGKNEILVFETEGRSADHIYLREEHTFINIKE